MIEGSEHIVDSVIIEDEVNQKKKSSRRRAPRERKWQAKQKRKHAKHPLWLGADNQVDLSDPSFSITSPTVEYISDDLADCGSVKKPPSEPLPTLVSLQNYVHQEISSRYGAAVEWLENPTTAQELLSSVIQTDQYNAFHVLDLGVVVKQALTWKKLLPRVQPYYAVKANPDINIVRTLFLLGVNFDCASKGEIEQVLSIGAEPTQIIYANPAKGIDHINFAKYKDVRLMTFDNLSELTKILKIFPDAELVLRIASNDTLSLLPFGFKFGASFKDAVALISACKELEAKLVGISFHVGSGCYSPLAFVDTLKRAKELFLEAERVGIKLTLLDIGGGFPGDEEAKITFEEIATVIGPVIDALFEEEIQVIAEPGRYFCSACTTTALQVYSRRDYTSRRLGENGEVLEVEEVQYYLPDGVYGTFNSIIYDHATPTCRPLKEPPLDAVMINSTFFGPTCDSIDVIAKQIHFPSLEIGDWVYFLNMGAYTVAAGSTFNGFERPTILYKMINRGGFTTMYGL
jgi:ornithine decarboxylase